MKSLKSILSISGRPGLFKLIAQTRTGILVESLSDKKRFTISAQQQVNALDEIAMYCEEGEKPLKEIYEEMEKTLGGQKSISHKSENKEIIRAFNDYVPSYDEDRVYINDMKKFFNWYNLLCDYAFFEMDKNQIKSKLKTKKNINGD
tara:strand:+ start:947 stop:1387 length:441 start_codon:yes stop_codon:yes gene_type:complete